MRLLTGTGLLALAAGGAWAEPSLERGTYLVEGPSACGNCHTPVGPDGFIEEQALAGSVVVEDEILGTAISANITPGGRVDEWTDEELVRAIREGIRPDGTVIGPPMPIHLFRGLSDDDVQSIVMYLRQVPAVENDPGTSSYKIPLPPNYGPPVENVSAPPQGVTVEYGAYLAGPVAYCIECHTTWGPDGMPMYETHLGAGGNEFVGPWGTSVSANITPHLEDGIADYTDEELATMITKGVRPDGTQMMPPMPFSHFAKLTDEDVAAIVMYLRSLPPLPDPEG